MTSFFMPSFATRANGMSFDELSMPQSIPPVITGSSEITFDCSPLLVSKSLLMDTQAFDLMASRASTLPRTCRNEMGILKSEGLIELRDYRSTAIEGKSIISSANISDATEFESWADTALSIIDWWMTITERVDPRFHAAFKTMGRLSFVIDEYVYHHYGPDDRVANGINLWKELHEKRHSDPIFFRETLEELFLMMMDYVNTNLLLSTRLNAAVYEWDNYQTALAKKLSAHADIQEYHKASGSELKESVSSILKLVVPADLSHLPIKTRVSLLTDRRIEEVRSFVRAVTKEGKSLDQSGLEMAVRYLAEVVHVHNKKRQISLYLKPLSLLIPSPSLDYALGVAWNVGEAAAESLASGTAEKALVEQRKASKSAEIAIVTLRRWLS